MLREGHSLRSRALLRRLARAPPPLTAGAHCFRDSSATSTSRTPRRACPGLLVLFMGLASFATPACIRRWGWRRTVTAALLLATAAALLRAFATPASVIILLTIPIGIGAGVAVNHADRGSCRPLRRPAVAPGRRCTRSGSTSERPGRRGRRPTRRLGRRLARGVRDVRADQPRHDRDLGDRHPARHGARGPAAGDLPLRTTGPGCSRHSSRSRASSTTASAPGCPMRMTSAAGRAGRPAPSSPRSRLQPCPRAFSSRERQSDSVADEPTRGLGGGAAGRLRGRRCLARGGLALRSALGLSRGASSRSACCWRSTSDDRRARSPASPAPCLGSDT